jgi:hypothetical protein
VEAHNGAAEAKNGAMEMLRAIVADSHKFDEEPDLLSKKPVPHQKRKGGSGSASKLEKNRIQTHIEGKC